MVSNWFYASIFDSWVEASCSRRSSSMSSISISLSFVWFSSSLDAINSFLKLDFSVLTFVNSSSNWFIKLSFYVFNCVNSSSRIACLANPTFTSDSKAIFSSCMTLSYVDEIVTPECIHLYFLCIVTQCLFRDVLESCHAPMFLLGGSIM